MHNGCQSAAWAPRERGIITRAGEMRTKQKTLFRGCRKRVQPNDEQSVCSSAHSFECACRPSAKEMNCFPLAWPTPWSFTSKFHRAESPILKWGFAKVDCTSVRSPTSASCVFLDWNILVITECKVASTWPFALPSEYFFQGKSELEILF